MITEIRKIITDQINRHVAMTDTHREWLAKDIADRVENEVRDLRDEVAQLGVKLCHARDDARRLDWLELTASGIDWQLNKHTKLITRAAIDEVLKEADLEEEQDIASESSPNANVQRRSGDEPASPSVGQTPAKPERQERSL